MKKSTILNKKFILLLYCASIVGSATAQVMNNSGAVAVISSGLVVSGGSVVNTTGDFTNSGTFTLSGGLTISAGNVDGNGTFNIGGDWVHAGGTFTGGSGMVKFNGTGAQSIGGASQTTFNDIEINKSGGTATLGRIESVAGNLTVTAGTLDLLSYDINRTASGGTLSVSNGAALKLGGTTGGQTGSNFPTNYSTVTLISGSTVEYTAAGAQTIYATPAYGNLKCSGSGAKTIISGAAVDIAGTLDAGGLLTIESTSGASGSLKVDGNTSGDAIYNRYMTGTDGGAEKWHLISSPVPGTQTLADFITSNVATSGSKRGIARYDPTGPNWIHYPTTGGAFGAGEGLEILLNTSNTIGFTGLVKNISPTPTATVDPGWNLIGNLYPSFIKMNNATPPVFSDPSNNFLTLNIDNLDVTRQALYVWVPGSSEYTAINHSSEALSIAPGQGFFIKSKVGVSSVSFDAAIRTHTQTSTFKSLGLSRPEIELSAETSGKGYKTIIRYIPNMTKGLDPGYDAGTFTGSSTSFSVFTRLVEDYDDDFAIQCLPDNDYENMVVPVGLNALEGSGVLFKAKVTNLPGSMKVYLEDKALHIFTRLDEEGSSYAVSLSADSKGTGRFYLHTTQGSLGIGDQVTGSMRVIPMPLEQKIRIIGPVGAGDAADMATLFDLDGRAVCSGRLLNREENELPVAAISNGLYILQIRTGGTTLKQKISWIR